MENKSITITNSYVIEYFEKNYFDPNLLLPVIIKDYEDNNKNLENKLQENISKNEILISKEELKIFYEEYKFFINQKTTVTGIMKEAYRESQCNLNRIKFCNLDKLFTKHLNIKKPSFICDICGIFTVSTKKGLITHKRKCSKNNEIKKYKEDDDEDDDEEDDYDDEDDDEKQLLPVQPTLTKPIPQQQPLPQPLPQQQPLPIQNLLKK